MKDIFLCSTFTTKWNIDYNSKILEALENHDILCYAPYRDTNQQGTEFQQNIEGIKNAKKLIYVSLNETPNGGGEVGFAYGINKPIVVLTTKGHKSPLMLKGMFTEVLEIDDLDNIDTYIDRLVEIIKK